jgi:hypothetical protein
VYFLDRNRREPCIGCDIFWEGSKGNRAISMSNKYAFNVIDMGVFHKVHQVDQKTGGFRINQKTNEPYTEWVKCKGVGCDVCQVALETKQGHIQPWPMSKTHFDSLQGTVQHISKGCTTCGGREVIETVMWQCGNPQCGELLFDISNTTATMDQILDVVNRPYSCRRCGVTAYPEEVIQCANCTPAGNQPRRATLYDVDLQVKAQPTGEGKQTLLIVLATSDPKPVDPQFAPLLEGKIDLAKKFAATPIAQQEKKWKRGSGQGLVQQGQPAPAQGTPGVPAQQPYPVQGYAQVPQQQPLPQFQPPAQQPPQPQQGAVQPLPQTPPDPTNPQQ